MLLTSMLIIRYHDRIMSMKTCDSSTHVINIFLPHARPKITRPDTRHKMRLVSVLFTFENNTGPSYGRTDGRTDTTSYRDATAHLKTTVNGWMDAQPHAIAW